MRRRYDSVIYYILWALCAPRRRSGQYFLFSSSQIYSTPGKCCRNITRARNNTMYLQEKMRWNYDEPFRPSPLFLPATLGPWNFLYVFPSSKFPISSYILYKYESIIRQFGVIGATRPSSLFRTNLHVLGEMSKEHGKIKRYNGRSGTARSRSRIKIIYMTFARRLSRIDLLRTTQFSMQFLANG